VKERNGLYAENIAGFGNVKDDIRLIDLDQDIVDKL